MRTSHITLSSAGALIASLVYMSLPDTTLQVAPRASSGPIASADAPHVQLAPVGPVVQTSPEADGVDPSSAQAVYRAGERLVRFVADVDAGSVLAHYGLHVAQPPGPSGFVVVEGSDGALAALTSDPRVEHSLAHAVTAGAGNVRRFKGELEYLQWYIDQVDPPEEGGTWGNWRESYPASNFVVAVLDTGVAYETAVRDGVSYVAVPGLASSPITAPYDFVNDDPHANDDHQHGTHIASLIAAVNTSSEIKGIAPGAGIMPIKVLDANNQGVEIDLVDGIWHAINNGADVINMSLSFSEGYQPSVALREALQAAHEADIVLVGASGNDGADYVAWPAASPFVMAIGSSTLVQRSEGEYELQGPAGYSNMSAGIDLMMSGGDITHAKAHSDLPVDGMLAESIALQSPEEVGYWLMAGTSQAAAVASGMAITMLQDGTPREQIPYVMQLHGRLASQKSTTSTRSDAQSVGYGAGFLDMHWGSELWKSLPFTDVPDYHVAVLPYLERVSEGQVRPVARVTLFDDDGVRKPDHGVLASLYGSATGIVECETDAAGQCFLRGPTLAETDDATGEPLKHAVVFSVEKVVDEGAIGHHPGTAMTVTPELQELVAALDADPATANALLGWCFHEHTDPALGHVAPAFSLVDSGSGLKSIPLGLVMSQETADDLGSAEDTVVQAAGHELSARILSLDGTGLKSIPLGFNQVEVVTIDSTLPDTEGSGLKSIPLGLQAPDAFGDGDEIVRMETTSALPGTPFGEKLASGGWSISGYGVASALSSSSIVAISAAFVPGLDGLGVGAEELPYAVQTTAPDPGSMTASASEEPLLHPVCNDDGAVDADEVVCAG